MPWQFNRKAPNIKNVNFNTLNNLFDIKRIQRNRNIANCFCPNCESKLDATTDVTGPDPDASPIDGSPTICANCAALLSFRENEDGTLRLEFTPDHLKEAYREDADLWNQLVFMKREILKYVKKKHDNDFHASSQIDTTELE